MISAISSKRCWLRRKWRQSLYGCQSLYNCGEHNRKLLKIISNWAGSPTNPHFPIEQKVHQTAENEFVVVLRARIQCATLHGSPITCAQRNTCAAHQSYQHRRTTPQCAGHLSRFRESDNGTTSRRCLRERSAVSHMQSPVGGLSECKFGIKKCILLSLLRMTNTANL